MAEEAPAAAQKKSSGPAKSGPGVSELIVQAVAASKERSGVSAAALKKALAAGGYDADKKKARINIAIKALVAKGTLVQTSGTGASGSFKMNKKAAEPKSTKPVQKAASRAKKPAAKKPAAAKKPRAAAAKKPAAAKKSPKKSKKPAARSPKKSTKSPKKGTKSPKKSTKSPKKAVKKTKAPAAKKPAAKKVVKPKGKKTAAKKK
ncbi:histone H1-like [Brachionichthys hirsutus]|uniref:histone H1-like n=1 Tax=Brachionichthys hirsutus TaxID=412623 RepID=UPI0036052254